MSPHDRADWALENVLVVLFAATVAAPYGRFPHSRISYSLIFIYLCLHEIGARYTYSRVPYNDWSQWILGVSISDLLHLERNPFDRLVHFGYGLLLA